MATTWYLGKPGALQSIRAPLRDYARTADPLVTTAKLISGAQVAQRPSRTARSFDYAWNWLAVADWQTLVALHHRQLGVGPFALLDPATVNYLAGNQASGTDARGDTTGFTVAGGESLASSTVQAFQGARSLAWTLPNAATSKVCTLAAPRTAWSGFPTPPSEPWVFSGRVRLGSGTAATVALGLQWLDSTGAQISESVSANTTPSTGSWSSQMSIAASAPATAYWAVPRLKVTGTVSATTVMYWDALQLERAAAASTWAPGEGLPAVSITALQETVPVLGRRTTKLTLAEVGA